MEKDQDEDEDEEEKIHKFFALVRSAREVRKLMVKSANKLQEEEENKKKKGEEGKSSMAVLNPSFQLEDFIEGGGGGKSKFPQASPEAGPSKRQDETEKEEDKEGGGSDHHGLDLKLSL